MGGVQPWSGPPQPWNKAAEAWQPAPTAQAAMRAAHTDRERTVDVLKAAYAEGRLSAEEYSQRFDATYQAQTYGQLAQLVADLPSGPMVMPMGNSVPVVPPTFGPAYSPPYPPAYPPQPLRTNPVAGASLALGLLCLPTLGMTGIPAVITGHLAKAQLRQTSEQGDGMATTGLVLGWLSVGMWAMVLFFAMISAVAGG